MAQETKQNKIQIKKQTLWGMVRALEWDSMDSGHTLASPGTCPDQLHHNFKPKSLSIRIIF